MNFLSVDALTVDTGAGNTLRSEWSVPFVSGVSGFLAVDELVTASI